MYLDPTSAISAIGVSLALVLKVLDRLKKFLRMQNHCSGRCRIARKWILGSLRRFQDEAKVVISDSSKLVKVCLTKVLPEALKTFLDHRF